MRKTHLKLRLLETDMSYFFVLEPLLELFKRLLNKMLSRVDSELFYSEPVQCKAPMNLLTVSPNAICPNPEGYSIDT